MRINLLPWREARRAAQRKHLATLAGMVAVLGIAVIILVHGLLATQIAFQNDRNVFLKKENDRLDKEISEIKKLKDEIAALLARKQVIERLQSDRAQAVYLLDQLVRQVPDGVYLKTIKQQGQKVNMIGYAQSNARVSTLMRNLGSSPHLENPDLVEIKAARVSNKRVSEFNMNVSLKRQEPEDGAGKAGKAAPAKAGAAAAKRECGMKQLLEQFQNLDPKDPGAWPAMPKALLLLFVLVAIIAGGYFADWAGQIEALDAGRGEEIKLKDGYKAKKQQAVNLDLYRQQLREIDSSFGALLKQLPNKSQMDALLVDINQAGLGRGLQFDLFKPAPQEQVREFYAELPITLKINGNFHDIGQFASDIGQLSRIVTLNDLAMAVNKDGSIVMDATAKTFRYLDEEEVAAQRKAVQRASAKGKK